MGELPYVRSMVQIHHLDAGPDTVAGITMVDTSHLPWPGATFSIAESATAEQVAASYEMLAATLHVDTDSIYGLHQVHGTEITVIDHDSKTHSRSPGDALVTTIPGIVIGVKVADCCGVLINDPVQHVIAAVHSGWRGTAQHITSKVIDRLVSSFHSDPSTLHVALSPCASGAQYEVGQDVFDVLSAHCAQHPSKSQTWFFDNTAAITSELVSAGILTANITADPSCTMIDRRFHSFRRDKQLSGRALAFIHLKK